MGRPAKPDGERVRDIAPTGVRLPPDLRDALLREATLNGRSLSQEITQRLQASVSGRQHAPKALQAQETAASYGAAPLGESQRLLLTYFNALPPDRQLALLTLLRR